MFPVKIGVRLSCMVQPGRVTLQGCFQTVILKRKPAVKAHLPPIKIAIDMWYFESKSSKNEIYFFSFLPGFSAFFNGPFRGGIRDLSAFLGGVFVWRHPPCPSSPMSFWRRMKGFPSLGGEAPQ